MQRCAKKLGKVRRHLKKITPRPGKDYVCPICERTEDQVRGLGGKKVGAWCIDHDHNTDTVRGHLCHDCNRALGNFKDSRVLLQRALEYLRSYNDTV